MKNIDLARTVDSRFPPALLQVLSVQFGLQPDMLLRVVTLTTPALVAASMAAGSTERGVGELFKAITARAVNVHLHDEIRELAATTAGLKALEDSGQSFVLQGLNVIPGHLSDFVAGSAGVPAQAGYALTGLTAAMFAGTFKHHVLIEQGLASELPAFLAAQWPMIGTQVNSALVQVLRFDDVATFRDTVPAQLRVLAGSLQRSSAQANAVTESGPKAQPVSERDKPSARGRPPRRSRKKLLAWMSGIMLGGLMLAAGVYFLFPDQAASFLGSIGLPGARQAAPDSARTVLGSRPVSVSGGQSMSTVALQGSAASAASAVPPAAGASGTTAVSSVASYGAAASAPLPAHTGYASAPEAAHGTRPATLVAGVSRTGLIALQATVASDGEKGKLLDALAHALDKSQFKADVSVSAEVAHASWLSHIDALLPLLRTHDADVSIVGQSVELGGEAGRPDWVTRMHEAFGASWDVSVFNPDVEVDTATAAFQKSLHAHLDTGSCDAIDHVLDLQMIDFAHGSAHIPATAMRNLEDSAHLLKACSNRARSVVLAIQAFSDDRGDAEANLDLSKKRAESVRAFLVQAGVAANSLTAEGFGVKRPIATNLTQRGRFANRRVVFEIVN